MIIEPPLYAGQWYEVASHKQGFYGLGQNDCMDTRGEYEYDQTHDQFIVTTQCRHLNGRVSGIRGIVKCPKKSSSCNLRFPTVPFVPPAQYRILETDYNSYSLVEGATDKSFVQIYARSPRPGTTFIDSMRSKLKRWGYDPNMIHVTPVTVESTTDQAR
jgi:lipocalin